MAARTGKKTLASAFAEVGDLKARAAVQTAVVSMLRGRYLARDSTPAPAKIDCDGAPVPERIIEEMACEFEEGAAELTRAAEAYMGKELT